MSLPTSTSTSAIAFIISRIDPAAPKDHEERLHARIGTQDHAEFRALVATVRGNPAQLAIDNGRPADLSTAQRRLVDIKINVALEALNELCPLQPGEQEIAASVGGLLTEPWAHLPAGTPLVTRTTSYGTVHMAWPYLRAENNELREAPLPILLLAGDPDPCWKWDRPIPDNANAHALYNWITTTLAAAFTLSGVGFLSPFLTFAGTVAFKPVTLKDVSQIATCRAQKISKAEDIALLINALGSMQQELQDTYLPAKQQIAGTTGPARTAKLDSASRILTSILTTNRNNVGMLSTDNLGFDGLVPYVAGASVILALYQELATIDSSAPTPAKSSFITSMHDWAGEAELHVKQEVGLIRDIRSGAIVMNDVYRTITRCMGSGMGRSCVDVGERLIGATWTDQITGESSGDKYTAGSKTTDAEIPGLVAQCQGEMEAHRRKVMADLDGKLKPLLDVAATFGKVPVPPALVA